ncbi:UPF0728 protein C10orf53 homolog [Anticarsia gemmatalis]|uniref:UPF0728 protein C10orf53 homolog n=1 Tax=Anticarsia gemmatalis TaxID=129554 RepID=UPI003F75FD53
MAFLYVKIYHGPCDTFYSLKHKPQRLTGLRDRLQKQGFRVDLIPVDYVNYCMIEMCGHEVFRCNIVNLQFNTHQNRDPVCQRAVEAVVQSSAKFKLARAYLWFWTLIEHQMFRRGPHAPKDYWPSDVDTKTLASCLDCVECCNILVKKKDKDKPNEAK